MASKGKSEPNKQALDEQTVMAFLACDDPPSALIAAGWTPSDLIAAGWAPSGLRAAGWTPSDLIAAGWTPSDLIAAGWAPSALIAAGWTPSDLRAAGWTPSDLIAAEKEFQSIPIVKQPYAQLLAAIESNTRKHDQSTFGPECDPQANLCKTPMCTAGHLVNMAGEVGYSLSKKYGPAGAARLIHRRWRPDVPPQNFGSIPQKFAMAYIRQRAKEEADKA